MSLRDPQLPIRDGASLAAGTKRELLSIAKRIRSGETDDPAILDTYCESFAVYALDAPRGTNDPIPIAVADGGRVIVEALGSERINRRLLQVAAAIRTREVSDLPALGRYRLSFSEFAAAPPLGESQLAKRVRAGGLAIMDALDDVGFPQAAELDLEDLVE